MGRRLLTVALCGGGGGRVATRMRMKQRVQRASRHPSTSKQLPAASVTGGSKAAVKNPGGGAGECYVNGNGALMVEVAGGKKKEGGGRRVMVVADGRKEAVGALQWALSQAVQSNDTVVLLSVVKPVAQEAVSDSCVKMLGPKCSQHIKAMRSICESTRPEVT